MLNVSGVFKSLTVSLYFCANDMIDLPSSLADISQLGFKMLNITSDALNPP